MHKNKVHKLSIFVVTLVFSLTGSNLFFQKKTDAARNIIFPVIGKSSYVNDFNADRHVRGQHRKHHAIDIIANKGQKLVAAVTGTIIDVQYPEPDWGYSVTIRDSDGYRYTYIHMNDDNPGTNDGNGGGMNAYAADIREGNKVVRGQLIGKVGDSGFSNGIPHLHFEMHGPSGNVINPYHSLKVSKKISKPVANYPKQTYEQLPHSYTFRGGASIDMGNFDGDIANEIAVGAGKGGKLVRTYEKNGSKTGEFTPYNPKFDGGIDVAAGDIDNDGSDEIITGAGVGGSLVKVFEPNGQLISSFRPYEESFKGGVYVASGDIDNDGEDEIITGPKSASSPRVRGFEMDGTRLVSFYAYDISFRGGIYVASGDTSGDTTDEIITGPGRSHDPIVRVFNQSGVRIEGFYAYLNSFRGGVRVESDNIRNDYLKDEILTVGSSKASPRASLFSSDGTRIKYSSYFAEEWWRGPYDIGVADGEAYATLGVNRRTSVRLAPNL